MIGHQTSPRHRLPAASMAGPRASTQEGLRDSQPHQLGCSGRPYSLVCWGCGSDPSHYVGQTVPVKGKVTYKGKPLTEGQIIFEPDAGGREAHGSIQPDGTFELTTFTKGDGAVTGTHRVAVTSGKVGKQGVPSSTRTPAPRRPRSRSPRGRPNTWSTSSDSGEIVTAPIKREDESDDGFEETRGEADPGIGGRICFRFHRLGRTASPSSRSRSPRRSSRQPGPAEPAYRLDNVLEASAVEPIGDGRLLLVAHDKKVPLRVIETATGRQVGPLLTCGKFPGRDAEIVEVGRHGPRFRGQLLPGRIALGQDPRRARRARQADPVSAQDPACVQAAA